MTAASAEQQRQLVALQRVDDAIRRLEHQRANLPEQKALDDNDTQLRQTASEYADAAAELEDAQRLQRSRESDIANFEARRKAEEGRLYSDEISSEKEAEAIRHELSTIRRKKSDCEDELLEAMERIEELQSRTSTLASRHADLQGKVSQLTADRDHAAGDLDRELTDKRAERERVRAELDDALVTLYEQVSAQQGAVAVAVLDGKVCEGCFLELAPSELEEIRREAASAVPRCPQCDRLLVVNP
jgi:predicted  nucleic acid-binding Zn-ribbon protein